MALGDEVIEGIAEDTGVSEGFASGVLGYAIPKIIGLLTSGGAIPEEIPSGCIEFSLARHTRFRRRASRTFPQGERGKFRGAAWKAVAMPGGSVWLFPARRCLLRSD